MTFKINIAGTGKDKGKTFNILADTEMLIGMKIGDIIKGEEILQKLSGYEFKITGASDKAGFPALENVEGTGLKKVLLKYGKGMRDRKPEGLRKRKTVHGNIITADIIQINLKVQKQGTKTLGEIFGKSEKEEKKEEIKKAE